jgi:hypothetical protein
MLLAFLLGMLGSPWFEASVRSQLPAALQAEQAAARDPRVNELDARIARLEAQPRALASPAAGSAEIAPLAARLAALEAQAAALQTTDNGVAGRLDMLAADLARTTGAAEAGDQRVRQLFVLMVARRMVATGRPLGSVEAALAARFGAQDAAAVEALGAWSRVPQTRSTLAARLEMLEAVPAQPASAAAGGGWWERLKARLSGLVTVNNGTQPGRGYAVALEDARAAMARDDLALAVARMERAPPGTGRDQWLQDARTLVATEAALERLEANLLDTAAASIPVPALATSQPPVNAPAPPQSAVR